MSDGVAFAVGRTLDQHSSLSLLKGMRVKTLIGSSALLILLSLGLLKA